MATKTAKPLGLAYDFNAFTELEVKYGINVMDRTALNKMKLTPNVVRQLVWAGLLMKNPDITPVEAGKRIPLTGLEVVIDEIQTAITLAMSGK